jgi:trk system potassium uptake protein TrkH
VPVYLLLLSGGFAFLRSPIATVRGNELSIDRAIFLVTNAVTLTGFQYSIGLGELRLPGQIALFVLMIGGMVVSLFVGAQLVSSICGLRYSGRTLATAAGSGIVIAALLGAVALGDTGWHGAFIGVSAVGNCGMFLGKLPACDDLATLIVLLPLAVAGGLGMVIWLDLAGSLVKRSRLSMHSILSISMYGLVYIVGLGLLLPHLNGDHTLGESMATCSASAITARSAGFGLVPLDQFTRAGQWILAALMVIGPASGGCGGGIKGTTFLFLFRGIRKAYFGKTVKQVFSIAAVWVTGYVMLVFVGYLILLGCAPQLPGDRVLFLAISAASNVGWSHDPVSLVKSSLAVLSGMMLLGRAMPLLVLWWVARSGEACEAGIG